MTLTRKVFLFFTALLTLQNCAALENQQLQPKLIESDSQNFVLQALATDLDTPWGLDFLPNGQLLITGRPGKLWRFNPETGSLKQLRGLPSILAQGQGGLLDVVLHPEFENNAWVYLSHVKRFGKQSTTVLSRATLEGNALKNVEQLLEIDPKFDTPIHFGASLLFDNDGNLWMTMGDRGNRHLSQDPNTQLGKTLRMDEHGKPLESNPFSGSSKANEQHGENNGAGGGNAYVFSYGHRNPQGITIDRSSGRIWVSEHGPRGGDEVNVIKAGVNYGWPVITYGREYSGGKIGEGTEKEGLEQPLHYYVPSIATAAVEFYDGDALPNWKNSLFVAGLRSRSLSRIQLDANGNKLSEERLLEDSDLRIREVRQSPEGWLYLLAEGGSLLRIKPDGR